MAPVATNQLGNSALDSASQYTFDSTNGDAVRGAEPFAIAPQSSLAQSPPLAADTLTGQSPDAPIVSPIFASDLTVPPPVDVTPPTAIAGLTNVTTAGGATYDFTITYSDDVAVNIASLDNTDVVVTGPNNFSQFASLVAISSPSNAPVVTATYRIAAPYEMWDDLDNGTYTVSQHDSQVGDTVGNLATAGPLGTFAVTLTPPKVNDRVFYLGDKGIESMQAVLPLSDGTILVGGSAQNLDWLPKSIPIVTLTGIDGTDSHASGRRAFILHLSPDLSQVLQALVFPAGTVADVSRLRSTEVPGQPTGAIYLSGKREGANQDGYYIARLNDNFLQAPATGVQWFRDIKASEDHKEWQGWDVGPQGEVYYVSGTPYDYSWAGLYKLDGNGRDAVVPGWKTHWTGETRGEINVPDLSTYQGTEPVAQSAIVLRPGRGGLRSQTQEDYQRILPDANGGTKQGTWPNDYFYAGPYVSSPSNANPIEFGPGYTGYWAKGTTFRCVAVTVDRRNGDVYFGYSVQSVLPNGKPDFEPAIVAMDAAGRLKWWSRLYTETPQNSPPDQYVDGLAIDYTDANGGALVVLARAHGNSPSNFWQGGTTPEGVRRILYPGNSGQAFQDRFTGEQGDIHLSWLGRFSLDKEELRDATYLAELSESAQGQGSFANPLLAGWFDPNAGWPDVTTTRATPNALQVDLKGNVYVMATGRKTITTSNAYVENIKPSEPYKRTWTDFVRVYQRDLSQPIYSSLFSTTSKQGEVNGSNTDLRGVAPIPGGLLMVGSHKLDRGQQVPSALVPDWGKAQSDSQDAFIADLHFTGGM